MKAQGKNHLLLPPPAEVAQQGLELERDLKAHVHHAIVGSKTISAEWLGAASGYSHYTAYHQVDPAAEDTRLSLRVLHAGVVGSLRVLGTVLAQIMGRQWGGEWIWTPSQTEQGTPRDVFRQIVESETASSESRALEWASMQDDQITPEELVALEERWAIEDRERASKRQAIRAMCQPLHLRKVAG